MQKSAWPTVLTTHNHEHPYSTLNTKPYILLINNFFNQLP